MAMTFNYTNPLFATATPGNPVTLPAGFQFASFNPETSSTYTITNSEGGNFPVPFKAVSGILSVVTTLPMMPALNPSGWAAVTITCLAGSVDIFAVTGN